MTLSVVVLLFVSVQRLGELFLARFNTARLMARGAVEVGAEHYPVIVLLHVAWLAGLWLLAPARDVSWPWLVVFAVLQGLRVWVLASLGPRWTTRIIVVPGEALVARGPYQFLSHPNYCVVAGEILVLALVFGLLWYGLAFSVLNAVVLSLRIRAEDRALRR